METLNQIDEQLKANGFFPSQAYLWEPGNAVYEGIFIQKVNDRKYMIHAQRHYALNPFQLAQKREWEFDSLDDVYIKWMQLENNIFD